MRIDWDSVGERLSMGAVIAWVLFVFSLLAFVVFTISRYAPLFVPIIVAIPVVLYLFGYAAEKLVRN